MPKSHQHTNDYGFQFMSNTVFQVVTIEIMETVYLLVNIFQPDFWVRRVTGHCGWNPGQHLPYKIRLTKVCSYMQGSQTSLENI